MPTPNYTPLAPGQAPTYGTSGAGVAAYQQQLNQQNAGQAGWTPLTVDGFYGNLTQQAANFQPQGGGAITPASLQPTTPINVPTGNPPAAPSVTPNAADSFLSTLDLNANEKAAQTSQESLVAKMLQNIQNQQGESAYKSELLQGSGLNTLKQDLQKYNSQILQKQAELNQSDIQLVNNMRNEERRDTLLPFAQMGQAKLAGDAAIMRGLKTAEIGVLNALAIGKQGDIQLAKETIQEAVDAKYAPYKEQNALYKAQLEAIQPFLDKAEKKQAVAQQFKLNQAMKEIDKISDFQKKVLDNAIAAKAPDSVISAISKGKTIEEITKAGRNYLQSETDKLDLALKRAQLNKINIENSQLQQPGGGKPATDTQIQNAGFADRISQANTVIDSNAKTFSGMNYLTFKLASSTSQLANAALTPEQRQVAQAMRNFITAKLRKESGAAISPSEFEDARVQYFPALNDDPQTLANKKALRDSVLNNLIQGSGGAYKTTPTNTYIDNVLSTLQNGGQLSASSYVSSLLNP